MPAYTYDVQKISEKIRSTLLAHTQRTANRTSLREISRTTGIDVAHLSRFANEQPGGKLGQDSLDALAECLGIIATTKTKSSNRKGDAAK